MKYLLGKTLKGQKIRIIVMGHVIKINEYTCVIKAHNVYMDDYIQKSCDIEKPFWFNPKHFKENDLTKLDKNTKVTCLFSNGFSEPIEYRITKKPIYRPYAH